MRVEGNVPASVLFHLAGLTINDNSVVRHSPASPSIATPAVSLPSPRDTSPSPPYASAQSSPTEPVDWAQYGLRTAGHKTTSPTQTAAPQRSYPLPPSPASSRAELPQPSRPEAREAAEGGRDLSARGSQGAPRQGRLNLARMARYQIACHEARDDDMTTRMSEASKFIQANRGTRLLNSAVQNTHRHAAQLASEYGYASDREVTRHSSTWYVVYRGTQTGVYNDWYVYLGSSKYFCTQNMSGVLSRTTFYVTTAAKVVRSRRNMHDTNTSNRCQRVLSGRCLPAFPSSCIISLAIHIICSCHQSMSVGGFERDRRADVVFAVPRKAKREK